MFFAAQTGKDGSWLKLQSDGKMIRLVIVTGASKTARKLRIAKWARQLVDSATGDIADLFGAEAKDTTPLNLVEATSEHVCMEFVEGVKHEFIRSHKALQNPQREMRELKITDGRTMEVLGVSKQRRQPLWMARDGRYVNTTQL